MRTLLFLCALLSTTACASFASRAESADVALVGGTIYTEPGAAPMRDGIVLVRDGVIIAVGSRADVAVPSSSDVIDCAGRFVTAGFWNSHTHFFAEQWENAASIPAPVLADQLRDMLLRFGFTSVFDTGSSWENTSVIRARIDAGDVPGPRIRSTGEPLMAPGAMPDDAALRSLGFMPLVGLDVLEAEDAREAADAALERGVDGVKLHLQPPASSDARVSEAAMRAAIERTHRAGKPVFVHPSNAVDLFAAVRSGVDVVAHTTPSSGPWDRTLLEAMAERDVALTPTLFLWETYGVDVGVAVDQLRAWRAHGGSVLFGSDLGAVAHDPSREYALMRAAGMRFDEVLQALTTAPAARFGDGERLGRVVPGFRADLTILDADPSRDVLALARVYATLRDGELVFVASD